MPQIPTTDQTRDDIDSGKTGEKVGYPDPAAAPLGTDDEAAGKPPTRGERSVEVRARRLRAPSLPINSIPIYLGAIVVVGLLILIVRLLV